MSYYRSSGRGRGGRYMPDTRPVNPLVQTKESPPPPLGELVEAINRSQLKNTSEEDVTYGITETELIASYNWADQKTPKIIVPGRPRLWKPLEKPQQLEEDNGVYYRDNNSAFFPKHPLEPAIVSVMKMHPQSLDIDIVGCNSTIGNLLRFVQGTERSFRMLVEVVGKTVHLIRRENSPKEQILGVRGFGHAFPDAYTTWTPDVQPSKSHHRILKFRFGGLDLLVRHSADGYIEDKDEKTPSAAESPTAKDSSITAKDNSTTAKVNSLGSLLESLSIGPASDSSADSDDLEVVDGGKLTSQDAIFDLKTRSIKAIGRDTLSEELPRLWLARITNFILAHHTRGTFDNVEVADVHDEVKEWEESHQEDLGRLSALLHRIQVTALEHEDTLLEIVRVDGGPLQIRKRLPDAGVAFSDEVRKQWLKWLGHEDEEPCEDSDRDDYHAYGDRDDDDRYDDDYDDYCDDYRNGYGDSDSEAGYDYTACDKECGYCGKCPY